MFARKFYIAILVMICMQPCYGMNALQDSTKLEPYKYVSLSAGVCFPLNKYAIYGDLPGFCSSLNIFSPIRKSPIGGIITVGAGINSSTSFGEGSNPEEPDFKWAMLLGGFEFSHPLHNTTFLDFRFLAGMFFLNLSSVSYTASTINLTAPNYTFVETTSSNYNEEFLFDIGISLRSTFKKTLFTISLDYCKGAEKANAVEIYTAYYYPHTTQQYSPPTSIFYATHFSILNVTITYGLRFKN